jgi:hypothetical protein
MHLGELVRIQLIAQFLQRRPDHRLHRPTFVAPGNDGVLGVGPQVVDVLDRDEADSPP